MENFKTRLKQGAKFAVLTIILIATSIPVQSQDQFQFTSGIRQTGLLELYTSQGCSSCPPADRWLSSLKNQQELWTQVVPMAFHVDYWDYIGWKDRYAQRQFGLRQSQYAAEGGLTTVYTPGMLLNGETWSGWRRGRLPKTGSVKAGELAISLDGDDLTVRFSPLQSRAQILLVHIAWLGFDLSSRVDAGENRGRRLNNDFIVLETSMSRLQFIEGAYIADLANARPALNAPRTAIAAWVASEESQKPLQAVGGWLDIGSGSR